MMRASQEPVGCGWPMMMELRSKDTVCTGESATEVRGWVWAREGWGEGVERAVAMETEERNILTAASREAGGGGFGTGEELKMAPCGSKESRIVTGCGKRGGGGRDMRRSVGWGRRLGCALRYFGRRLIDEGLGGCGRGGGGMIRGGMGKPGGGSSEGGKRGWRGDGLVRVVRGGGVGRVGRVGCGRRLWRGYCGPFLAVGCLRLGPNI